jgi:hypothetical protein
MGDDYIAGRMVVPRLPRKAILYDDAKDLSDQEEENGPRGNNVATIQVGNDEAQEKRENKAHKLENGLKKLDTWYNPML